MNFNKLKLNRGISIVETIIYLAIFTIISIVVINSFIVVLNSFAVTRTNHTLLNSGSLAMDRIAYEIRQASSINAIITDGDTLCLKDISALDCIVKFEKNVDTLELSQNGSVVGNMLSSDVILTRLVFNRISGTNSEAVKIEMDLQNINSKIIKTETFYNTVVLRGAY